MAMIDAKVIFVVVLVTVLLASLGSWYIVLPEYLQEKKRRKLRQSGWVSVKERMPEAETIVIVYGRMKYAWEKDFSRFVDVATYDGQFFDTVNDWYEGQQYFDIVYWMPLPEPPKEGSIHDL